jgi:hypothetical protein
LGFELTPSPVATYPHHHSFEITRVLVRFDHIAGRITATESVSLCPPMKS